MARLLLVEDEAKVRRSLQKGLEEEGYEVVAVDNGNDGLRAATSGQFDCLILDLMLPGRDGLEILQHVRAAGNQTQTIILTARGAVEDRVRGLDAGADDYLPKPFAFAELLARTINGMIARLEHAFNSMRQFTADASHELLTPLTAMRTEVEVSQRVERSPEQYRRVLGSVLEEVERMTKLADGLLLPSREDAKPMGPEFERLRLDLLVQEVAGHMRALAEESGIAMTVDDILPSTVLGGADALRQVFFNLLDNAVKYTPPGGSLTIRGRSGEGEVVIDVRGTGIGIPLDSVSRVFDRFYRVDKSRSRELGGTGLGLSITKALVERHQGHIEVESIVGRGSTFRVYRPVMGEDQVETQQEAKP